MKLKAIRHLSAEQKDNISTLFGVYAQKPVAIAKYRESAWVILQHKDGGPLSKDKELVQICSCQNLDEVLNFLHTRKMTVFCPKEAEPAETATGTSDKNCTEQEKKRRNYHRKNTLLKGEFTNTRTGDQGKIIIKDLSLYGIGFVTEMPHDFKFDDVIDINFELDTPRKPIIRRKIRIKYLNGLKGGGEIIDPPDIDPDLGAYLMP